MCGSGTFLIEAALMARGIAPGLARARNEGFACERWKDFDATAWAEVITEAKKRVLPRSPARIHGADAHAAARHKVRVVALEPLHSTSSDLMHPIFTDVDRPARAGTAEAKEITGAGECAAPFRCQAGLEPGV